MRGCPAATRTTFGASDASTRAGRTTCAPPWLTRTGVAVDDAALGCQARCAMPTDRRPRVGGELQRRRAPHDRIGGVDRHVGDALERRRPCRRPAGTSPAASARRRWRGAPGSSRRRRALRRAPPPTSRTRSRRGRAGCRARAAPSTPAARRRSGLTTPWKLCTRPSALTKVPEVSVNGVIGSSTSATSSQRRHEGGQRDDHLGAAERGERRAPGRPRRARARRSAAGRP